MTNKILNAWVHYDIFYSVMKNVTLYVMYAYNERFVHIPSERIPKIYISNIIYRC